MNLANEIGKIPSLREAGIELVQYAKSLAAGEFEKKGNEWVFYPDNFVVFRVQWKRKQNIVLTLRACPRRGTA